MHSFIIKNDYLWSNVIKFPILLYLKGFRLFAESLCAKHRHILYRAPSIISVIGAGEPVKEAEAFTFALPV